jgi:hypothetical protein
MRKSEDLDLRMKRYGTPGDLKRHMHSDQKHRDAMTAQRSTPLGYLGGV